jgi:hypothetical protein
MQGVGAGKRLDHFKFKGLCLLAGPRGACCPAQPTHSLRCTSRSPVLSIQNSPHTPPTSLLQLCSPCHEELHSRDGAMAGWGALSPSNSACDKRLRS